MKRRFICFLVVLLSVVLALSLLSCKDDGKGDGQPQTYTVSFLTGEGATQLAAVTVESNGRLAVPDVLPQKEGSIFVGWYKDEACTLLWNFDTDTVTSDMTIYIAWADISESQEIAVKLVVTDISVPPLSMVGYTFDGYYSDEILSKKITSNEGLEGKTVFAKWKPKVYNVTLDTDGGTAESYLHKVTYMSLYELSIPVQEGMDFVGWYDGETKLTGEDGKALAVYAFDGDINVKAVWKDKDRYTVSYNANGGSGSVAGSSVYVGGRVSLSTGNGMNKEGYALSGWNTSADGTGTDYPLSGSIKNYPTAENLILYAVWEKVYDVSYNGNGGDCQASSDKKVFGSEYKLPSGNKVSRSGYTFLGWNTKANGLGDFYEGNATTEYPYEEDVVMYAVWEKKASAVYVRQGNKVSFGEYPQRLVTDEGLISAIKATIQSGECVQEIPEKKGACYQQPSSKWIVYNGDCYAMVESGKAGYEFADASKVDLNNVSFYKVEKLSWTIISTADGIALLLSDYVLDERKFDSDTAAVGEIYPNNWENSEIREWLSEYFYENAFNSLQQELINTSSLLNDKTVSYGQGIYANGARTQDKVFLLSYVDAKGLSSDADRKATLSAYSAALSNENNEWFLRTVGSSGVMVTKVDMDGKTGAVENRVDTKSGIRPALYLKLEGFEVEYIPENATGEIEPQTAYDGVGLLLRDSGFTRTGYTLIGWNGYYYEEGVEKIKGYALGEYIAAYTLDSNLILKPIWEANDCTIIYNANNGNGQIPNQTAYYEKAILLSGGEGYSKEGYKLSGWSRSVNGSGEGFELSQSIVSYALTNTAGASLTLYAVWTPNTYNVTYFSNGGNGSIESEEATFDKAFTISSGKDEAGENYLIKKTGHTLEKWNTSSKGEGDDFALSYSFEKYNIAQNLTLYAVWRVNEYKISYDANGGTGTIESKNVKFGDKETLSNGESFSRPQYTFERWNTQDDGKGTSYGKEFVFVSYNVPNDLKLYAIWKANTYVISYFGNGGSGTVDTQTVSYGSSFSTKSADSFKKEGHTIQSWNTDINGNGSAYTPGKNNDSYTLTNNLSLYAIWVANKYTISYNSNGGTGSISNQEVSYGGSITLDANTTLVEEEGKTKEKFTKEGYTLKSWNTKKEGDGNSYELGETIGEYNLTDNLSLYAIWGKNTYTISYDGNGGTGKDDGNGGTVPVESQQVAFNGNITLYSGDVFVKRGYYITSWQLSSDENTNYTPGNAISSYSYSNNITLKAVWKLSEFTVTYVYNGGSVVERNPTKYTLETPVTYLQESVYIVGTQYYEFLGWYDQDISNGFQGKKVTQIGGRKDDTDTIGNMTLYASWGKVLNNSYTRLNENGEVDDNGGYIALGEYPQSLVSDETILSSLENGIASGSVVSDRITGWYTLGSDKYAKLFATPYGAEYTFNNNATIERREYFFKVEPIIWRIMEEENKMVYLVAETLLTPGVFFEENNEGDTSWENSNARSFLNDTFLNTAFKSYQRILIQDMTSDNSATSCYPDYASEYNNTVDKVTLLSYAESVSDIYGYNTSYTAEDPNRIALLSDYALAKGARIGRKVDNDSYGIWWLRSPMDDENISVVYGNGSTGSGYRPYNEKDISLRPAIRITLGNIISISYYVNDGTDTGLVPMEIQHFVVGSTGMNYIDGSNMTRTDGYTFSGWNTQDNGEGAFYEAGAEIDLTEMNTDLKLYAVWKAPYKIEYKLNGGQNSENNPAYYNDTNDDSNIISLFDPTYILDGSKYYAFLGWYDSATFENKITEIFVENNNGRDLTLYAKWETTVELELSPYTRSGNYVEIGEYPQSLVTDEELINKLKALNSINNSWISYDGEQYAPISKDDGVQFFKVEPIRWRIISEENGVATIIPEKVLISMPFDSSDGKVNRWADSSVRAWLNNDFYATAFKSYQQAIILDSSVSNSYSDAFYSEYASQGNTSDKLWLLSAREGRKEYIGSVTAFAKVGGASEEEGYGIIWTRSPGNEADTVSYFGRNSIEPLGQTTALVDAIGYGICPVMRVELGQSYMIYYDANGGEGEAGDKVALYGKEVALNNGSELSKPGYTFVGWNEQSDGSGYFYEKGYRFLPYNIDYSLHLYAVWEANEYIVTFEAGVGSGTSLDVSVCYGEDLILSLEGRETSGFSKANHLLTGWKLSLVQESFSDGDTVVYNFTSDCKVTAIWSQEYVISYILNGGKNSNKNAIRVISSTTSTRLYDAKYETNDGQYYGFVGWFTSNSGGTRVTEIPASITEDLRLYARWEPELKNIPSYRIDGDYLYMGSYPQSLVTDDRIISMLENGMAAGYERYFYKDGKYYEYEEIKWRIVSSGNGKITLVSDKILDSGFYLSEENTGLSNREYYNLSSTASGNRAQATDWSYSDLRKRLNDNFFNEVFNEKQRNIIVFSDVDNSAYAEGIGADTKDRIYIPTESELQGLGLIFGKTDYSGAEGYWLRESEDSHTLKYVLLDGTKGSKTVNATLGILPVMSFAIGEIYSVSYFSNKGVGAIESGVVLENGLYVVSDGLTDEGLPAISREGYSFLRWNTKADGSGTSFERNYRFSNYGLGMNLTLYAVWTPNTFDIEYNSNGGVGSVPTATATFDSNYTIDFGRTISKDGYTLLRWDTKADGTGGSYDKGYSFTPYKRTEGLTLYAIWTEVYNVNYRLRGGINSAFNPLTYYKEQNDIVLLDPKFEVETQYYRFLGWYDGMKESSSRVTKISKGSEGDLILYARWEEYLSVLPAYTYENDEFYFGSYPQSLVTDEDIKYALSQGNGIYDSETGWYKYNDVFYAAVTATPYEGGYTFCPIDREIGGVVSETKEEIVASTVYYFLVEPIKWQVLSNDGKNALLLADLILDKGVYNQDLTPDEGGYANNWENSDIRAWLQSTFYEKAFSDYEKLFMLTQTLSNGASTTKYETYANGNDTIDLVALASYADTVNVAYHFSHNDDSNDSLRMAKTSDYSRALGVWMSKSANYEGNGNWWLRSSGASETTALSATSTGKTGNNAQRVDYGQVGVRPLIYISLSGIHTVSYDLDGGMNNEANPSYFMTTMDDVVLLPPTKQEGSKDYEFLGWYTDLNDENTRVEIIDHNGEDDLFLYAKWSAESTSTYVYNDTESGFDTVSFGEYPSVLADNDTAAQMRAAIESHSLSADAETGWYEYGGEKYARVIVENTTAGFEAGESYFFKVEPIMWYVLNTDDGKMLLLSASILDTTRFLEAASAKLQGEYYYNNKEGTEQDEGDEYATNWEYSDLRNWLNGYFYNVAFSQTEKTRISGSEISEAPASEFANSDSVTDMLFTPSYNDIINALYGFYTDKLFADSARLADTVTPYSLAKGIWYEYDSDYNSCYLLRSAYSSNQLWAVGKDGVLRSDYNVITNNNNSPFGIRPMLLLSTGAKYIISYDANGGFGSEESTTVLESSEVDLSNGSSFMRLGHRLLGWSTTSGETATVDYISGYHFDSFINQNLQLYAVWEAYTVSYENNGGIGSIAVQSIGDDEACTLSDGTGMERENYFLTGWSDNPLWNTSPQANDRYYPVGYEFPYYNIDDDLTLYAVWTRVYTIHYINTVSDSEVLQENTVYGYPVTLSDGNSLIRTGYSLTKWRMSNGTLFDVGALIEAYRYTEDITLYTVWTEVFEVSYDANGVEGIIYGRKARNGETIVLNSGNSLSGAENTILTAWNTQADGLGTSYALGAEITIESHLTLYAVWSNIYEISYYSNEGVGEIDVQRVVDKKEVTLSSQGFTRTNYTLVGWKRIIGENNDKTYALGEKITYDIGDNVVLYAVWATNFTISYRYNDGSGRISNVTVVAGKSYTLSSGENITSQNGTLKGWNTKSDGSGTSYNLNEGCSSYDYGRNLELFAVWEADFTISYDRNGGDGTVPSNSVGANESVTLSDGTSLSKVDCIFTGWKNTETNEIFAAGETIDEYSYGKSITLYAQWLRSYTISYIMNGGQNNANNPSSYNEASEEILLENPTKYTDNTYYIFDGWYDSGNIISTILPSAARNYTLTAKWSASPSERYTYDGNYIYLGEYPQRLVSDDDIIMSLESLTPNDEGQYLLGGRKYVRIQAMPCADNLTFIEGEAAQRNSYYYFLVEPIKWLILSGDDNRKLLMSEKLLSIGSDVNSFLSAALTEEQLSWIAPDGGQNVRLLRSDEISDLAISYKLGAVTDYAIANGVYVDGTDTGERSYEYGYWWLQGSDYYVDKNGNHYETESSIINPAGFGIRPVIGYYFVQPYTISYDNNNGNGVINETEALINQNITFSEGEGFTKTGYTLTGWNTKADERGTAYALGETVRFLRNGDLKLYAVWRINTVSYDNNGGVGTVPDTQIALEDGSCVLSNGSRLSKAGFVLDSWTREGTGEIYALGETLTGIDSSVRLLANWSKACILSFDSNGGSGTIASIFVKPFGTVSVQEVFSLSGYEQVAWNTQADGKGKPIPLISNITLLNDLCLYAVWTKLYQITYSTNLGTGTEYASAYYGSSCETSLGKSFSYKEGTTDYFLVGWNTRANGTGTNYRLGESFDYGFNTNLSLFACWEEKVELKYDANGGYGTLSVVSFGKTSGIKAEDKGFTRDDCEFLGWNTKADGRGVYYAVGDLVTLGGNVNTITLYAVWGTQSLAYTLDASGESYVVSGYTKDFAEVIIPSYYMGLPVIAIGNGVFEGKTIRNLKLSVHIRKIESGAFERTNIAEITISDEIIALEGSSFENCLELKTVVINSTVIAGQSASIIEATGIFSYAEVVYLVDGAAEYCIPSGFSSCESDRDGYKKFERII